MKKRKILCLILLLFVAFMWFMNFEYDCNKFNSNLNNRNIFKYNKIEVLIQLGFDDKTEFNKLTNDLSLECAQNIVLEKRLNNIEYYSEKNKYFLQKYNLDDELYQISRISPFIFKQYDNYFDYIKYKNYLLSLTKEENVSAIYINHLLEGNYLLSSDVNSSNNYEIESVKETINIDNQEYFGSGIKIGIIENGLPDNMTNFSSGQIKESNTSCTDDHATKVASIVGGTYGIASQADLYFHTFDETKDGYGIDDAITWLLLKGVNIINISMRPNVQPDEDGFYTGYSAYLDSVIYDNDVIIVNAAGNEIIDKDGIFSDNELRINQFAMGTNVIAVGSVNSNMTQSSFSGVYYDENYAQDCIILKPNIMAPGEISSIPNVSNNSYGTSFAAPVVTGTIALLMEEFPTIINKPQIIMSLLLSTAQEASGQTHVWQSGLGNGIIDYYALRMSLLHNLYSTYNVTTSTPISGYIFEKSITVESGTVINYCLANMFKYTSVTPSNNEVNFNCTNYSIDVFDSNGLLVSKIQEIGSLSTTLVGKISNSSSSSETFTFKVKISGNKIGTFNEKLCLSLSVDSLNNLTNATHTYEYSWVDLNSHRKTSLCGLTNTIEGHVISSSDFNSGEQYATCLLCGGRATIGFIQIQSMIDKVSDNGSVILSNGLIVLVPNDIEDFIKGSLVFYDKNTSIK